MLSFCSLYICFSSCHVKLVLCRHCLRRRSWQEEHPCHTALGNTSQPGDILIFCVRWSTKEDTAADHRHWLPSLKNVSLFNAWCQVKHGCFSYFHFKIHRINQVHKAWIRVLQSEPKEWLSDELNSPLCT